MGNGIRASLPANLLPQPIFHHHCTVAYTAAGLDSDLQAEGELSEKSAHRQYQVYILLIHLPCLPCALIVYYSLADHSDSRPNLYLTAHNETNMLLRLTDINLSLVDFDKQSPKLHIAAKHSPDVYILPTGRKQVRTGHTCIVYGSLRYLHRSLWCRMTRSPAITLQALCHTGLTNSSIAYKTLHYSTTGDARKNKTSP